MKSIFISWIAGAILLFGFSLGFDAGCQREQSIKNPIVFSGMACCYNRHSFWVGSSKEGERL